MVDFVNVPEALRLPASCPLLSAFVICPDKEVECVSLGFLRWLAAVNETLESMMWPKAWAVLALWRLLSGTPAIVRIYPGRKRTELSCPSAAELYPQPSPSHVHTQLMSSQLHCPLQPRPGNPMDPQTHELDTCLLLYAAESLWLVVIQPFLEIPS